MRPKIPETLEKRIKSVYEQAGYSTESEFVRDAVRSHLNQTQQSPTDNQVVQWLRNDELTTVLDAFYTPVATYDLDSEGDVEDEMEMHEEGNLTILVEAFDIEIWLHRQFRWESLKIDAQEDIPIDLLATSEDLPRRQRNWRNHIVHLLLLSPGYLEYVDNEREEVDHIQEAEGIRVSTKLYPDDINRGTVLNTIINIANTIRFISELNELFKESIQQDR